MIFINYIVLCCRSNIEKEVYQKIHKYLYGCERELLGYTYVQTAFHMFHTETVFHLEYKKAKINNNIIHVIRKHNCFHFILAYQFSDLLIKAHSTEMAACHSTSPL